MAVLAGVTAPLILSGSASGGFVGITTASKPNPFGLFTVNVYAIFDRPGQDRMELILGTPNTPLRIEVHNGTFYNNEFGGDMAPSTFLVGLYPSLEFDTFVTIGVKAVGTAGQPKDNLVTVMVPFGITGSVLECDSCGWGVAALEPQGNPFDSVNSFPGNGQILIGQFATADGSAIAGTMLLQFISNGAVGQAVVSFYHVPSPGALAMMGAAGLIGTRRRRANLTARNLS